MHLAPRLRLRGWVLRSGVRVGVGSLRHTPHRSPGPVLLQVGRTQGRTSPGTPPVVRRARLGSPVRGRPSPPWTPSAPTGPSRSRPPPRRRGGRHCPGPARCPTSRAPWSGAPTAAPASAAPAAPARGTARPPAAPRARALTSGAPRRRVALVEAGGGRGVGLGPRPAPDGRPRLGRERLPFRRSGPRVTGGRASRRVSPTPRGRQPPSSHHAGRGPRCTPGRPRPAGPAQGPARPGRLPQAQEGGGVRRPRHVVAGGEGRAPTLRGSRSSPTP